MTDLFKHFFLLSASLLMLSIAAFVGLITYEVFNPNDNNFYLTKLC